MSDVTAGRIPGRSQRLRVAAVAAVLFAGCATLLTRGAADATGCAQPGKVTHAANGWTMIAAPHFATGPAAISAYAVDRVVSDDMLATNGQSVMRSAVGGCSWSPVFSLPSTPTSSAPFVAQSATITTLALTNGGRSLCLIVTDGPRLAAEVSSDSGATWKSTLIGLANPGATPKLTLASTWYLVDPTPIVNGQAIGSALAYTSNDLGATWTPASSSASAESAAPGAQLTDLAVDPVNTQLQWAGTTSGLLQSGDGGTTWKDTNVGSGDSISRVAVGDSQGTPGVAAFEAARGVGYFSSDGGSSWGTVNMPSLADSSAVAGQRDALLSSGGRVYGVPLRNPALATLWRGTPPLSALSIAGKTPAYVFACSCGSARPAAIWRHTADLPDGSDHFAAPSLPTPLAPVADASAYGCSGKLPKVQQPKDWAPSQLLPATKTVVVSPGQSLTVPYQLLAAPREMDVDYLVQTGYEMEFGVCPFETGAAMATNALGQIRNLFMGLGDVEDYQGQPGEFEQSYPAFVYLRRLAMSHSAQQLEDALGTVRFTFASDKANSDALLQAATGVGQVVGGTNTNPIGIPSGQEAEFGSDAYRVIMFVTGSYFNDPTRNIGYPGLPNAAALAALQAHDIHQVGVYANNLRNKNDQSSQNWSGFTDLGTFAKATGAVAHTPIDCQGDNYKDIKAGAPLVCNWFSATASNNDAYAVGDPLMGQQMTKLLLQLTDPEPVRVVALSGATAVGNVSPSVYRAVDLLKPHQHPFSVTFHCGPEQVNQDYPVTLGAIAGGRVIATGQVTVHCGNPAPHAQHLLPIVPPPPLPPVPQPIPNPNPGPNVNPAPNPAPNPAQAPQAQAQGAAQPVVVPQRQVQPQLAFQQAIGNLQPNEAMSALPGPAPDPLRMAKRLLLFGGTAMFGLACALRSRTSLARARSRRTPGRR